MGRGLDGFFCFFPRLVRFSRLTEAVSKPFGGEIARGKHLFPFRTEPLSLSAPMVLGGQPPGRVGRRRSFNTKAAPRGGFRRSSSGEGEPPRKWLERLSGDAVLRAGPVVQVMRSARGEADRTPLAVVGRLRLDAVFAERREVDHQVSGVEQPLPYVNQLSHGRQATGGAGRKASFAGEVAGLLTGALMTTPGPLGRWICSRHR